MARPTVSLSPKGSSVLEDTAISNSESIDLPNKASNVFHKYTID